MGIKNNLAKLAWWKSKSPSERSAIMSARVKKAWSRRTPTQIQAHVAKMNKARLLTKS